MSFETRTDRLIAEALEQRPTLAQLAMQDAELHQTMHIAKLSAYAFELACEACGEDEATIERILRAGIAELLPNPDSFAAAVRRQQQFSDELARLYRGRS